MSESDSIFAEIGKLVVLIVGLIAAGYAARSIKTIYVDLGWQGIVGLLLGIGVFVWAVYGFTHQDKFTRLEVWGGIGVMLVGMILSLMLIRPRQ